MINPGSVVVKMKDVGVHKGPPTYVVVMSLDYKANINGHRISVFKLQATIYNSNWDQHQNPVIA